MAANPYGIKIETIPLGTDYLICVTGGRAHIGAVVTAYQDDTQIHMQTQIIPGHLEGELATQIAKQACTLLGHTITVVMGIHIDNATKQEIHEIISWVERLAGEELDRLARQLGTKRHG
ncbi:prenylated flavin chaperone LpdD [Brevibacillus migulae]|uniref:prenylated flavin chaperone LpdD n=1 Tax=Brevibacillus migulae TaxID=1644114 RepID=UPI00106EB72F|nr:hypothetical protein [Brevibacillus migulae]